MGHSFFPDYRQGFLVTCRKIEICSTFIRDLKRANPSCAMMPSASAEDLLLEIERLKCASKLPSDAWLLLWHSSSHLISVAMKIVHCIEICPCKPTPINSSTRPPTQRTRCLPHSEANSRSISLLNALAKGRPVRNRLTRCCVPAHALTRHTCVHSLIFV